MTGHLTYSQHRRNMEKINAKKNNLLVKLKIQHVDEPVKREPIDIYSLIIITLIYAIILMVAYAITGNVLEIRAEDYTLANNLACKFIRLGV